MVRLVEEMAAERLMPASLSVVHAEEAVFDAMLRGWTAQMTARALSERTVAERLRLLRHFARFTGEYPWSWTAEDMDAWSVELRQVQSLARSSLRSYQISVRHFCDYLVDGRYGWSQVCWDRFGTHPVQICHEWNTLVHV